MSLFQVFLYILDWTIFSVQVVVWYPRLFCGVRNRENKKHSRPIFPASRRSTVWLGLSMCMFIPMQALIGFVCMSNHVHGKRQWRELKQTSSLASSGWAWWHLLLFASCVVMISSCEGCSSCLTTHFTSLGPHKALYRVLAVNLRRGFTHRHSQT